MSITQADKALERYYKQQNAEYFDNDGKGKFMAWAEDNGFDTEGINDEFEVDPDESTLIDLDDDFPGNNLTAAQIISIIERCWKDPDAYTNEVAPLQVTAEDWLIEDHEVANTTKLYEKQCPLIFNGGMKGDRAIIRLLTVGEKLKTPYLQFLADMYTRDRLSTDSMLAPQVWGQTNRHIKELKGLKSGKNEPHTETLSAIGSFFHRIVPKLMLNSQTQIKDSIEEAARYITASVEFVSQLANQPQLSCPFQVDTCIAFNETKDCSVVSMQGINQFGASDDDDDDDEDDDDELEKKEGASDFYDCFGNIKHKLKENNLPHTVGQLSSAGDDKGGVRTVRMFMEPFSKFKANEINAKYKKNKQICEHYPRQHRFVSLIDKRKPKEKEDRGTVKEDEIIFFEPPNNCNTFPTADNRGHVPLWYFDSSKTCIIPNEGYEHGKHLKDINKRIKENKDKKELYEPVTSTTGCKGALIVLSFHVESDNEIRAYLYINGQVARFLPNDIIDILPHFFDKEFGSNKKWKESKEAKAMVSRIKSKLKDVRFEAFYNEYKKK